MKKSFLISFALALTTMSYAQSKIEFQLEQSRAIEPIQQVFVRPLVADLKMLSTEKVTFTVWMLPWKKIGDITEIELDNAIKSVIHRTCKKEKADLLVASTYEVRNHIDEKGRIGEMGIDITVSGYPAKYEKWRAFNEREDLQWSTALISAQGVYGDLQKTKAVTNNK